MVKASEPSTGVAQGADEHGGAGTHFVNGWQDARFAQSAQLLEAGDFAALLGAGQEEVQAVRSADELLHRGIAEYTFIPGEEGVLGRGKFSTVYKVKDSEGRFCALKHTPLYPHHPLIAARLLREPTLLAQIPPHPCLIGVQGWIKTRDHFYLVEDLSEEHISLADIPTPIQNISLIRKILDQLVSVVRDGLHSGGRVCHRDLKTENILINDHGDLILLDLGLATRYSASAPKLTTCCGSPAFHSPEIVQCLNNPPGSYQYYGPELDIWCIGLTLLSLLTGRRYPIGASHKHVEVMAQAVSECLQELRVIGRKHLLRQSSPLDTDVENMQTESDWRIVVAAVTDFLQIEGSSRMLAFNIYKLDDSIEQHVAAHKRKVRNQRFKTVSFEPCPLKYTIPVFLEEVSHDSATATGQAVLRLRNTQLTPSFKIHSYIKYLLRSTGILYHVSSKNPKSMLLQCVMVLPPDSSHIPKHSSRGIAPALLNTIFGKRSTSVPPLSAKQGHRSRSNQHNDDRAMTQHCIRFWIRVDCDGEARSPIKAKKEPLLSPAAGWVPPFFADLVGPPRRPPSAVRAVSYSSTKLSATATAAAAEPDQRNTADQASVRRRSVSQHSMRRRANSNEKPDHRFIDLQVSDARCLETLVNVLQSSQTQGLLSPQSVIGELDIDDRDQAIQEAMQIREKGMSALSSRFDQSVDLMDGDGPNARGLHLLLSRSHNGSHMPLRGYADSDDDEESPIIRTPVFKDEFDAAGDERASRSKETRNFGHLVKSRAELPDIQITPINAYHYERAHSASPARFTRALPNMS